MTTAAILHTITCIIGRRVVLNVLQPHITPLKGANFLLKQYFYVLHLLTVTVIYRGYRFSLCSIIHK